MFTKAPATQGGRRRLRAALRGVQQVLSTGCPMACAKYCRGTDVGLASPNLWRVRNLPREWVPWCAAVFRAFGYCSASSAPLEDGQPPALLVGYPDPGHSVPRQAEWAALAGGEGRPPALFPPDAVALACPAEFAHWLRVGDLLPACTALPRLSKERRTLVFRKTMQWLPPIKACVSQCLEELWGLELQGVDARVQPSVAGLLRAVAARQAWPGDVSACVQEVADVWALTGEGGPPPPAWRAALTLAVRVVPAPRLQEEPGLRGLIAHHVLDDVGDWCRRRRCACITPVGDATERDTATPTRIILLRVYTPWTDPDTEDLGAGAGENEENPSAAIPGGPQ